MYNRVDCTNKQYKMYNARTLTINNVSLGLFENSIIYLRVSCH